MGVLRVSCETSVAANFGVLGETNPMKVVGSRNDPMKLSIIGIYACLQNNTGREPTTTTFSPSSCLTVSTPPRGSGTKKAPERPGPLAQTVSGEATTVVL